KETIQQSLKEMRLLIYELRPSILSNVGLLEALQHRLDTVEKRAGIITSFKCTIIDQPSAITETELYGIAQEALNNVLKHSGADSVSISLTQLNQEIILEITDDGLGFQLQESPASGGFGISSMKERAEKIGGRVEITSKPDRGTRIKVYAPLEIKGSRGIL
ncbi:sensor histidine kinase, partial [bacterium]|nr:sensor histidine kinase [bacterium]